MKAQAVWLALAVALVFCSSARSGRLFATQAATGATQVAATAATTGGAQTDQRPTISIRAFNAAGRPEQGVRLFSMNSAIEGTSISYEGQTNSKGLAKVVDNGEWLLGLAKDGRLAISKDSRRIAFGPVGSMTVKVTDGQGNPIANQQIDLVPTLDPPPLMPYGSMDVLENCPLDLTERLSAITDAQGVATYSKLPVNQRFAVITAVRLPEMMRMAGAVEVGMQGHVVIAHDREVVGHVYDENMNPVSSADVSIEYDPHDAMAPAQTIQSKTTDKEGSYEFSGLPNCRLGFTTGVSAGHMVSSRVNGGDWLLMGYEGERQYRIDGTYTFEMHTFNTPDQRVSKVDFRLDKPIVLNVKFKNPHNVSLEDIFAGVRQQRPHHDNSDLGPMSSISGLKTQMLVGVGRYEIYVARLKKSRMKVVGTIETHPGDKDLKLSFDLPTVLKPME